VGEASDQPGGDAYLYALRDEQAYLQTDDDKPAIIAAPSPDPAQLKCWFCRRSHRQVQRLFGAEYPVLDFRGSRCGGSPGCLHLEDLLVGGLDQRRWQILGGDEHTP
jgi:hypothetical protein